MIRVFTVLVISILVQYLYGQFQIEETNTKCGLRECVVISKCQSVLKLVFQVNVNRSQQNTILQAKHQNYFVKAPMHVVTKEKKLII